MAGLADSLMEHHRYCDRVFEEAAAAAAAEDWEAFKRHLAAVSDALNLHIAFEEDELFPAFEEASGLHGGPTEVMRAEHEEMRELLAALGSASPQVDPEGCRAELEQLQAMLQEHNVKEEGVLYPACEQLLAGRTELQAGAQALNDAARSLAAR
jgi:iron-sulfur cluster repair protein YtfE (RIC family)